MRHKIRWCLKCIENAVTVRLFSSLSHSFICRISNLRCVYSVFNSHCWRTSRLFCFVIAKFYFNFSFSFVSLCPSRFLVRCERGRCCCCCCHLYMISHQAMGLMHSYLFHLQLRLSPFGFVCAPLWMCLPQLFAWIFEHTEFLFAIMLCVCFSFELCNYCLCVIFRCISPSLK